jgi:hypothetical protein
LILSWLQGEKTCPCKRGHGAGSVLWPENGLGNRPLQSGFVGIDLAACIYRDMPGGYSQRGSTLLGSEKGCCS